MRKPLLPLRALLVTSSLFLGACVIAITDDGARFHTFSSYESGPRIVGSGQHATRAVEVAPFERFVSDGSWDVELEVVEGATPALELSGDDNILDHVRIERDGGELRVRLEHGNYKMKHPLVVRGVTGTLDSVALEGSGDVRVRGLDGTRFSAGIYGSGDIELAGKVADLNLEIAGSGAIDAFGLRAENVRVEVNGSGEAHVTANATLNVEVNGSGEVAYRGQPNKHVTIAGSGEVYAD